MIVLQQNFVQTSVMFKYDTSFCIASLRSIIARRDVSVNSGECIWLKDDVSVCIGRNESLLCSMACRIVTSTPGSLGETTMKSADILFELILYANCTDCIAAKTMSSPISN